MAIHQLKPNMVDPTGARSFPNIALETKLLVDHLKDKPEGTIIKYEEMASLIGRPVTPGTKGYSYLTSARRMLIRDFNVIADSEPKIGIRICTNDEKMVVSGRDMRRARRATQRSGQKLDAVIYDRLDDGAKKEWNARKSVTGALNLMNTERAVAKTMKIITDHALPSANVLELFKK